MNLEDTDTDRSIVETNMTPRNEVTEDILIASTRILNLDGDLYIPERAFEEAFTYIDEIRDRVGRILIYVDNVVHRVRPPELFADLIDRTAVSLDLNSGNE